MFVKNVAIESVEYVSPPHAITSAEIENRLSDTMQRLGMKPGYMEALTGIHERRWWDPGTMPSDAATMAARKVIETSGIDPGEIGAVINTSVSKDCIEPSVACLVHGNLKLPPTCMNYDVGNACLGFVNGMMNVILMIEAGLINYGLIVNGESSREPIEATIGELQSPDLTMKQFFENFATLTLGSGAVAMLLCRKDLSTSGHYINGAVTLAATQHSRLCLGQPTKMVTDAQKVLLHGVELAHATWQLASETLENWSDETIDVYIPHQVSLRNMDALNTTLGLTPEKSHLNLMTQGNVGPAALPITLAMARDEGRFKPGSHVALMGIGSGLNCTMMSTSWNG